MTTTTLPVDWLRPVRRFARTPKGMVLIIFLGILALAVPSVGLARTLPGVLTATAAAAAVDLIVIRVTRQKWVFPGGAILTGLIVAMLLSPYESAIIPPATAILAIASKYLVRVGTANVFNPAALALVVSSVLFGTVQSWWGALPDLGWAGVAVLLPVGWFIVDRINKAPLVLTFMAAYFGAFTVTSFAGHSSQTSELFRAPDLHAVLFFALFMLDDPPTCPIQYRHQIVFGLVTAAGAYATYELLGSVYYLLVGLLMANLVEGVRRRAFRRTRPAAPVPPSRSAPPKSRQTAMKPSATSWRERGLW